MPLLPCAMVSSMMNVFILGLHRRIYNWCYLIHGENKPHWLKGDFWVIGLLNYTMKYVIFFL